MKLLLLDNYDSFTYNLAHYLESEDLELEVRRNDEIEVDTVAQFDAVLISPGPGMPEDAGITKELIKRYVHHKPILGVCLGAQALAEFFGAELYQQNEVAHGIQRSININPKSWLLSGLGDKSKVGLYHSWAINPRQLSQEFKVVAKRDNEVLMAFEHGEKAIAGVQFHPESVMTENGKRILKNWLLKAKTLIF